MHFSRTLINAVVLTIALAAPTQAFANLATTPATPPVEAPVGAVECATVDVVTQEILASVPDADILSISPEPPYIVVYTSPSMPTDLAAYFDANGCLVSAMEVTKTIGS